MQKRVTSPKPYDVKVEMVRGMYGECQIIRVSGDDRNKGHLTWQIR